MKTILLIGLGRFGRHVAMKLHELNHQVMAVDQDEEKVNRILPYVTSAQIGDSTNEEFLASLGVRNFDVCIVAIGDNFQSSLETASLLKEAGAKKVVARAEHKLRTMGASPEVDLRGMMTDEAISVLERFLDTAMMGKLETVTIIHGKGTGAVRKAVRTYLKRSRYIKSFRPGRYGEGEDGVTVAELR